MPQGRRMTRPYRSNPPSSRFASTVHDRTAAPIFGGPRASHIVATNKPSGPLAVGDTLPPAHLCTASCSLPPWRQPAAASTDASPLTVSAFGSRTRLSGREQPGQNSLIACGEEAHLGSSDRLGSWSSPQISMLLEVFCRRARAIAGRWAGTEQPPFVLWSTPPSGRT